MSVIKFGKKGIKANGEYFPVHYSAGEYTKESKIPKGTITIYAKKYGHHFPLELNPKNDTDIQTDYFEKDRARIFPSSPYFKNVLAAMGKR